MWNEACTEKFVLWEGHLPEWQSNLARKGRAFEDNFGPGRGGAGN